MHSSTATALWALLGASTTFASYAPPPIHTGSVDGCATACYNAYRTCQGNTTNTRAQCASDISSCLGYRPFDNSGSFVTPTACASTTTTAAATPTAPAGDECASKCVTAFGLCNSNLTKTRAECSAELASCVNYNPFTGGPFVTPTACSKSAPSTTPCPTSTSHPAPAPPAPTHTGDACASNCYVAFRNCQSNLTNTRAQCAAEISSCLGYLPFDARGSFVTPTACSSSVAATPTAPGSTAPPPPAPPAPPAPTGDCAHTCYVAYRNCQSNLTNTRAQCAAEISSCLNYVPYDASGSFITPTACSSSAAPTPTAPGSPAPPPPPAGPPAPAPTGDCAATCVAAYRACQGAPGANQSLCASNISSCLGYLPFDASGSFVPPTACSSTPPSAPTSTPPNATTSAPAVYTGAAAIMNVGGPLAAMAAGAAALLI